MEIINHECYVSLEVAKLLKEAGFDWLTHYSYDLYLYNTEGEKRVIDGFATIFCNEHNGLASMPTLEVSQRWLREVKKISVEVKTRRWVNRYQDGKYTYSYSYELWPIDTSIIPNNDDKFIRYTIDCACNIEFQTYEEAQEAGIKKALEMILEKEE